MPETKGENVIGFIASTVEKLRDELAIVREQMATKDDVSRLEGRLDFSESGLDTIEGRMATKEDLHRFDARFSEQLRVISMTIRGDIEQVQLRLDGMEHSISSRFEHVESELSRLRSAVYMLGKNRPDVLRLLGQTHA